MNFDTRYCVRGYDAESQTYRPLRCNAQGTLQTIPALGSLDVYGRFRISEVYTMFESQQTFDNEPLLWYTVTPAGTSAAHSSARSSTTLSVNATTSATAKRETRMWFKYGSGKSQLFGFTALIRKAGTTGITSRVGCFNDNDGAYFESRDRVMYVGFRSSVSGAPVDTTVAQSSWNVDKCDGTGPSGVIINFDKIQIYEIVYQWQGGGILQMQVRIGPQAIIVHQFQQSNNLDSVWCSNPNLPCRYEITGNGSNDAGQLEVACFCVQQEANGNQSVFINHSIPRLAPLTTGADTDWYVLEAIRLKSNRRGARVKIENIQVYCTTNNADFAFFLIRNPTLASGSYSWADDAQSSVQVHRTTNLPKVVADSGLIEYCAFSFGDRQSAGITSIASKDANELALGFVDDSTPEVAALVVRNLTAAANDFYGEITFQE